MLTRSSLRILNPMRYTGLFARKLLGKGGSGRVHVVVRNFFGYKYKQWINEGKFAKIERRRN